MFFCGWGVGGGGPILFDKLPKRVPKSRDSKPDTLRAEFRFWGLGFKVEGLGFRVQGFGSLGFRGPGCLGLRSLLGARLEGLQKTPLRPCTLNYLFRA